LISSIISVAQQLLYNFKSHFTLDTVQIVSFLAWKIQNFSLTYNFLFHIDPSLSFHFKLKNTQVIKMLGGVLVEKLIMSINIQHNMQKDYIPILHITCIGWCSIWLYMWNITEECIYFFILVWVGFCFLDTEALNGLFSQYKISGFSTKPQFFRHWSSKWAI
jgi:hypothetical protein